MIGSPSKSNICALAMDSAGLAARASTSIWQSPIVPTLELEDAEEIEAAEWEEEALAPSSSLPAEVASCCVGMMTGQCTPCAQKRGRCGVELGGERGGVEAEWATMRYVVATLRVSATACSPS